MTPRLIQRQAFTLIEMAIVIVVISLIIGGITIAAQMTANAKVMNLIAEKEKMIAAVKQFKEKYKALPGDIYNATSFWPAYTYCPRSDNSTAETCNGNGNGKIALSKDKTDTNASTGDMYEAHRAWQHLALAGIITGFYNGGMQTSGTIVVTPGTRVPASSYADGAGWEIYYVGPKNSDSIFFDGDYKHILYLGAGAYDETASTKAIVSVKDLQKMDIKADDGNAATGNIRSGKNAGSFGGACVSSSTLNYDVSSEYSCVPIFLTGID